MKTKYNVIAVVLAGVWLAAVFSICGCATKPRPSESVLDTPEHHVQSGMKLIAMEKYDDAMREFDLAKGLDPKFSPAFVGSGLVRGYKNDFKQGLKHMDKALDLAETKEQEVDANVGLIRLYLLGKESANKNWLSKARKAYKKAVKISPESSAANYYMGECYKEGLMFGEASKLFKRVLDINNGYVVEANDAWKLVQKIERAEIGRAHV